MSESVVGGAIILDCTRGKVLRHCRLEGVEITRTLCVSVQPLWLGLSAAFTCWSGVSTTRVGEGVFLEPHRQWFGIWTVVKTDVTNTIYTIQLIGNQQKLDAFIEAVKDLNILEVVRSGVSGISRGDKVLSL